MQKKVIMITGICGNSYGAQIAKSLSLLRAKYIIVGADCVSKPYSDDIKIDKFVLLPHASNKQYINQLHFLYKKNRAHFLIEGSETEQKKLNSERIFLYRNGINWISNSKKVIDICIDKNRLTAFLSENGFYLPKTYSDKGLDLDTVKYPVILKPRTSSGGSKNVYIAQSKEDFTSIMQLSKIKSSDFCIQEYIGDQFSEYTVGILHNNAGKFLGAATLKRDLSDSLSVKIKSYNIMDHDKFGEYLIVSSGFSQGTIMRCVTIEEYCRKIAERLESTGPLNFQGRFINEKFYIFEINPRFSGTSYMRALSGINEADLWIENMDDFNPEPNFIEKNKKFYRTVKEHIQ